MGADIILFGDSYIETYTHAIELRHKTNGVYSSFDDPDVIPDRTVAMEILRQHPGDLNAIFVTVGGGGLIPGIAVYVKLAS